MRRRVHVTIALLSIIVLAASLRLAALELRPPHHDEGVNGWFVEKIRRDGYYAYDPTNYHGPSYFYLLTGAREALGFGLWQLRLPGALAGIALCILPLALRRTAGCRLALATCGLLAASPTLVYYARYAIHETLLAALGLAVAVCTLRWAERGHAAWAIGAAAATAGMITTKETAIIFLAVAGVWLLGETLVESVRARAFTVLGRRARWSWRLPATIAAMLAVMGAIHVVAFTAAFQQPGSITTQLERSVDAYFVWQRTGTAHATGHEKDWCYYLHLGARYELVIYVLALAGLVAGWRARWVRGPGLVGFGMLAVYSAIAYKMPWLPASWLALLALPAARGLLVLTRVLADEVHARAGMGVATIVALVPMLVITVRSSIVRPADAREQLAYVHTDADYNRWFGFIEEGGRRLGRGNLLVAIELDSTWPLPYSLEPYRRTRWAAEGNEDVIVAGESRHVAVEARLDRTYLRRRYRVRDSAETAFVYLRRSLYEGVLLRAGDGDEFALVGR